MSCTGSSAVATTISAGAAPWPMASNSSPTTGGESCHRGVPRRGRRGGDRSGPRAGELGLAEAPEDGLAGEGVAIDGRGGVDLHRHGALEVHAPAEVVAVDGPVGELHRSLAAGQRATQLVAVGLE